MGQVFSPLDEELGLLPGKYTPKLQAALSRWGAKLPFREAVEEIAYGYGTQVGEATLRRVTYETGRAAEQLEQAVVNDLEAGIEVTEVNPAAQLVFSVDGSFIHLTNGEWREVKSVAMGEFGSHWSAKERRWQTRTTDLSYFSRSYAVRQFERGATAELMRRGLATAREVVTVNDGAEWIQQFVDYQAPKAVRILDFSHALARVATAGKLIWGEGSEAFHNWFGRVRQQFQQQPPQRTLADLYLLRPKATSDEERAQIDRTLFYLESRLPHIDYPHFRYRHYPIGSGSVESGHKVVVQRRFKQAGMRWEASHVDPLLALRDVLCNDRWSQTWPKTVTWRQQQRWHFRRTQLPGKNVSPPLNLSLLKPIPSASAPSSNQTSRPYRPPNNHPWKQGFWPTRFAWRWHPQN